MKYFERWRTKYLYIVLAGNNIPATALENWLLDRNPYRTKPTIQYDATLHGWTINITLLVAFLTNSITPIDYHTYDFFLNHVAAIKELAEGKQIWVNGMSESMIRFQEYIELHWLPIVTNTQLVERWVKDSNECPYTGKDDHFASMVGVCHSSTVFEYKEVAKIVANT